jgi:P-type conjugative transfer protein TrbL
MNAGILDTITAAFVDALHTGQGALAQYALPLLAILATIAFYLQLGPLVASGGAGAGDAVASALLMAVRIGVFYWLLVKLAPLAEAALLTFLQWGIAPTGGGVSAATFLAPSKVLDVGFRLGWPIRDYTDSLISWAAVWNWPILITYSLAYYAIVVSFAFIALHLMMTLIEYYLAVMVATVLIPFGVLQPTAFFTEFSIGWVTGGLIRILITAGLIGIALPLFDLIQFNRAGGVDPTFYSAVLSGLTSLIFAILSWVIPGRAAAIAGRGVSLALHAGTLVAGAASAGRLGLAGGRALHGGLRGVSRLLESRGTGTPQQSAQQQTGEREA